LTESQTSETDFVEAFAELWKRLQKLWERNLATLGLTLTEIRILRLLSDNGPSPMAKLAAELYMTPASITGLVDRLEADGLVVRERNTRDRRVVTVRITSKGDETFEKGRKLYRRFVENTLRSLTKAEARQLIQTLAKLSAAAESE
jgi:MarR family transcriptional regulator, temperature-dependent positive regulator of motility